MQKIRLGLIVGDGIMNSHVLSGLGRINMYQNAYSMLLY